MKLSHCRNLVLSILIGVSVQGGAAEPVSKSDVSGAKAEGIQIVRPGEPRAGWDFSELSKIPVLAGGRMKPLDSFFREAILFATGRRTFDGWEPADLALSWVTGPDQWMKRAFIKVGRPDVRTQLLLDADRTRYAPGELLQNTALMQYASGLNSQEQRTAKSPVTAQAANDPRDQELNSLVNKVGMFRQFVSGDAWSIVPQPAGKAWLPVTRAPAESRVPQAFSVVVRTYAADNEAAFQKAVANLKGAVTTESEGRVKESESKVLAEFLYNESRPFFWSFVVLMLATLVWLFAGERLWLRRSALLLTASGFAVLVYGLALRIYVSGRPPVTNMYESVIWVAFGTLVFGFIIYALQRQSVILGAATGVSAFCIFAVDSAPAVMDPGIAPLVPVLRSNFWLTIHVLTITLGYAAFALGFGLGLVVMWKYLFRATEGATFRESVFNINQHAYRTTQFGVVLLAAGTILGGIWADMSWGRFWGWDPKETWALIALLVYLAVLHGRFTGWVDQFTFPASLVLSFLSVIMAWYGVNFVLGAGLHSYGFGGGGLPWVAAGCLGILLFVGVVAAKHYRGRWMPGQKKK